MDERIKVTSSSRTLGSRLKLETAVSLTVTWLPLVRQIDHNVRRGTEPGSPHHHHHHPHPQVNINTEDAESFFPRTHLRLGSSESGFQNSNLTPGEDEGIWEVPIIHLACGLFWRKNLALSF